MPAIGGEPDGDIVRLHGVAVDPRGLPRRHVDHDGALVRLRVPDLGADLLRLDEPRLRDPHRHGDLLRGLGPAGGRPVGDGGEHEPSVGRRLESRNRLRFRQPHRLAAGGVAVGAHALLGDLAPDEVEQLALLVAEKPLFPRRVGGRLRRGAAAHVGELALGAAVDVQRPGIPVPGEEHRAPVRRPPGIGLGAHRLGQPPLQTAAIHEPQIALEDDDLPRAVRRPGAVRHRDGVQGEARQALRTSPRDGNAVILVRRISAGTAPAEIHVATVRREPHIAGRRADEVGTTHDVLDGELEPLSGAQRRGERQEQRKT